MKANNKNKLKEIRTDKKLPQSQLAEMVGVSRNTIVKLVHVTTATRSR